MKDVGGITASFTRETQPAGQRPDEDEIQGGSAKVKVVTPLEQAFQRPG